MSVSRHTPRQRKSDARARTWKISWSDQKAMMKTTGWLSCADWRGRAATGHQSEGSRNKEMDVCGSASKSGNRLHEMTCKQCILQKIDHLKLQLSIAAAAALVLSYLVFGRRSGGSLVAAELYFQAVNCQFQGVVFVHQLLSVPSQTLQLRLADCNHSRTVLAGRHMCVDPHRPGRSVGLFQLLWWCPSSL